MGVNSLESIGVGQSKEHHTEEITVDDIMDVLIESLSKDKDVFDYNREINSDPWFQKQAFGGFTDKFSFIDPWKFISQIYGTPFGMSQASTTYGQMYGLDRSKFGNAAPGFENPYQTMMTGGMGVGFGAMGAGGMGGGFGGMGGGFGGMGGRFWSNGCWRHGWRFWRHGWWLWRHGWWLWRHGWRCWWHEWRCWRYEWRCWRHGLWCWRNGCCCWRNECWCWSNEYWCWRYWRNGYCCW